MSSTAKGKGIPITRAKGAWNFRISDMLKTSDGTDFNPCGEFR